MVVPLNTKNFTNQQDTAFDYYIMHTFDNKQLLSSKKAQYMDVSVIKLNMLFFNELHVYLIKYPRLVNKQYFSFPCLENSYTHVIMCSELNTYQLHESDDTWGAKHKTLLKEHI